MQKIWEKFESTLFSETYNDLKKDIDLIGYHPDCFESLIIEMIENEINQDNYVYDEKQLASWLTQAERQDLIPIMCRNEEVYDKIVNWYRQAYDSFKSMQGRNTLQEFLDVLDESYYKLYYSFDETGDVVELEFDKAVNKKYIKPIRQFLNWQNDWIYDAGVQPEDRFLFPFSFEFCPILQKS